MSEPRTGLSRRGFLGSSGALLGGAALFQLPLKCGLGPRAAKPGRRARPDEPGRIDVHQHFLPPFYREALIAAGQRQPDGMPGIPPWSEAACLAMLDQLRIRTALLSISSPGVHFGDDAAARRLARQVNEEGARLTRAHPARFGFFAALPLPDVAGAVAEARYALEVLKADGVVLETNAHGIYLGDSRLRPLYQELDRARAVVLIHPTAPDGPAADLALGYPKPILEFIFETTRAVTQMILSGTLDRYAELRVIVPHAGAALPILANRVQLLASMLDPLSQRDIRAALKSLHYDLAGAPLPESLGALLQVADPERLHYGSDWPFTPAGVCRDLARQLDATPLLAGGLQEAVMHGNAERLFPRLAPRADQA
jgi:6-methylsalicylate decarboxylase